MIKLLKAFSFILIIVAFTNCSNFKNTPAIPKPKMVFIQGGNFNMGDVIDSANTDALPRHVVTVPDFYIGETEVTFSQYDAFAKKTGRPLPEDDFYGRENRAVVQVNWYEASAYCKYWGWRLPTESEWEYAARAKGGISRYSGTNSKDSLIQYAVTSLDDLPFTQRVKQKKPNRIGLYDMSGNAFEWIGEYYQFYEEPENTHDLNSSAVRIIRGGSFSGSTTYTQTFWRVGVLAEISDNDIGFRCAVSQDDLNKSRFLKGLFHRKPAKP